MATYAELLQVIKTINPNTEMNVGGKLMKGHRLKNYLISKLTHPKTIDLQAEAPKQKAKAKENQLKEE